MATLLGALESMKAKLDEDGDVKPEDTEIEAAMIAVMEDEQEVEASNTEIMELDDVVDEAESAVERLEGIRDAILEYGISKSMMKAVDPKGELCAAGIVASYEELEDTPVKDANAEAAVEGLVDQLKKIWSKLKEIFTAIWNKLKSWGDLVMRGFRSYETLLKAMYDKLKDITVDEAELDKIEANVVTKFEFGKINEAIRHMLGMLVSQTLSDILSKLEKAVEDTTVDKEKIEDLVDEAGRLWRHAVDGSVFIATGLKFNEYGSIERGKARIVSKNQTMKAAGWSGSEISHALDTTYDLLDAMSDVEHVIKRYSEVYGSLAKLLAAQIQKIKGLGDEEGRRRHAALNGAKTVANSSRKLLQFNIQEVNKVAKMALTFGRAALKAEKK